MNERFGVWGGLTSKGVLVMISGLKGHLALE